MILNIRKRHPKKLTRPLIYFDLVMILLPAQLGGSIIGNILKVIFPSSALYIIAFVILWFAIYRSTIKAIIRYQDELLGKDMLEVSIQNPLVLNAAARNNVYVDSTISSLTSNSGLSGYYSKNNQRNKEHHNTERQSQDPDEINPEDRGQSNIELSITTPTGSDLQQNNRPSTSMVALPNIKYPKHILITLFIMYIVFLGFQIAQAINKLCTQNYYLFLILSYIPLIMTTIYTINYVVIYQKEYLYNVIIEEDIDFRNNNIYKLFILIILIGFIGVLCSLLGIGGGELIGPILLSIHITKPNENDLESENHTNNQSNNESNQSETNLTVTKHYKTLPAEITTSTTSVLELFTSFTSIIHNIITKTGNLQIRDCIIFLIIGSIGGLLGRLLGFVFVEKYKKSSYLIITLIIILIASSIVYISKLIQEQPDFTLNSYCP